MNKSTKVILITAGALIGSGLIIGGIGYAASGFSFRQNFEETYERKEAVITDDFSSIEIEEISDDVMIVPSEGDEVRVVYYDSNYLVHEVGVAGNTLNIKVDDLTGKHWWENVRFSFDLDGDDDESRKTILYLPAGDYESLTVSAVSSDVSVPQDYSFTAFELNTVSGDLSLLASVNGNITVEGVSSSLRLSCGDCGSIKIDTVSGNVDITDCRADGSITFNTTSGDIILTSSSAVSTEINVISGDITLTDYETGTMGISATSGDISGNLLGDHYFDIDTVSGDITLPSNIQGAPEVSINTVSGDICLR